MATLSNYPNGITTADLPGWDGPYALSEAEILENETAEERAAETIRLASLPVCPECRTLIDEANGDEVFGDHHSDCFTELVVRARRRA
jgi:hypothetical protein